MEGRKTLLGKLNLFFFQIQAMCYIIFYDIAATKLDRIDMSEYMVSNPWGSSTIYLNFIIVLAYLGIQLLK